MASSSDCLRAALDYASRGWRVIALHTPDDRGACSCQHGVACDSIGKHPRYDRELLPNGLKDATTDAARIQQWWRKWPTANVGIITGPESGLYVMDTDPKSDGFATLTQLEKAYGALPLTPRVTTGSGGSHDFLAYPPEGDWPNTAGKLGPGIDTRGRNGYVVAPPSLHASGGRYHWDIYPDEQPLAALPDWVAERVRPEEPRGRATEVQPGSSAPIRDRSALLRAFGQRALAEELAALASTGQGGRNNALNRAAYNLGQLIPAALDEATVVAGLEGVALAIGLGVREAAATIRSGLLKGMDQPRNLDHLGQRRDEANHPQRTSTAMDDDQVVADASDDTAVERPMRRYMTEYSNAQRLVAQHGQDLCYVAERGWHIWNGLHWELDRTGEVMRRAKAMARTIEGEVEDWMDDKQRELLVRWARSSESRSRLMAAVALAESEPGIPVRSEDLDTDPWLVTCSNGTIDLRTGQLGPHQREHRITKALACHYDPDATCPTWERFLHDVMDGNAEKIAYLQRAVGYTLTGSTKEEVLFLMYGSGGNGKSKFLETLRELFGSYGAQTDPSTFLEKPGNDRIPTDIARLAGARLVSAAETGDGKRLSEVLIKQITGGDTITARFLFRDEFEFKPACKLFFATNHKPVIKGTDDGIWRRMRLIPFTVQIPEAKRDRDLLTKLRAELPGILAWAVRGCLAWQQGGLQEPADVKLATEDYRAEMDIVGAFLGDCCVIADGLRVTCEALYSAYHEWCDSNGEWTFSQRRFAGEIERRGFVRVRGAQGKWFRAGLGLLARTGDDPEPEDEPPDGGDQVTQESPSVTQQVTQVIQGDPKIPICCHDDSSDSHATNSDSYVTLDHLDHLAEKKGGESEERGEYPPSGPPAGADEGSGEPFDDRYLWPLPDLPKGWAWRPVASRIFCQAQHIESRVCTKMYNREKAEVARPLLQEIAERIRKDKLT